MLTCFAIHFLGDNQEYFIRKFSDESTARFVTCPVITPHPRGTNTCKPIRGNIFDNILRPTKGGDKIHEISQGAQPIFHRQYAYFINYYLTIRLFALDFYA